MSSSDYHLGYYEGLRNATAMLIDMASQVRSEEVAQAFSKAVSALAEERDKAKQIANEQAEFEEEDYQ
ncbi:MAG: hypothetical protein CME55_00340 [Halieaceae bacterium]|nr:hypothetical protein [Halieaceae bacterium]|tara:strand:- start:2280 stop:2483 length:204 start_codon:yes stop_codon:yes gene_type:complete